MKILCPERRELIHNASLINISEKIINSGIFSSMMYDLSTVYGYERAGFTLKLSDDYFKIKNPSYTGIFSKHLFLSLAVKKNGTVVTLSWFICRNLHTKGNYWFTADNSVKVTSQEIMEIAAKADEKDALGRSLDESIMFNLDILKPKGW